MIIKDPSLREATAYTIQDSASTLALALAPPEDSPSFDDTADICDSMGISCEHIVQQLVARFNQEDVGASLSFEFMLLLSLLRCGGSSPSLAEVIEREALLSSFVPCASKLLFAWKSGSPSDFAARLEPNLARVYQAPVPGIIIDITSRIIDLAVEHGSHDIIAQFVGTGALFVAEMGTGSSSDDLRKGEYSESD